jgi:C4-type Zn-finger protein
MNTIKDKCPICENKNAWKEDKKEFNIDDVKKSVKHLIYVYCEECGYILDFEMY